MKILVVSQYFWPENFIINDIVRTLAEQGHEVVVATGKPNYPDGNVSEGYRAWGTKREYYLSKIEVLRVPLCPRGKGGALNLLLNYLSFVVAGLCCLPWMLRKRSFEAILVFAPSPITQAIPAIPLKWFKKARLALWVQDLWPESLEATGFIKNPHLLKVVGCMVRLVYRCCDLLLVQSRAFVEPVAYYGQRQKIHYYPNSIDACAQRSDFALPEELAAILDTHFCVTFAGNLGTAQALETLVQAAIQLREESGIRLVLVGSGSRLAWLYEQKRAHGLENLILPGRLPSEAMPQLFERSSVLLVSLSAERIFAQTIPSKIQAYLAAGKPIIAALDGEGARVVQEAKAGVIAPAEQVQPLVTQIRYMKSLDYAEREAMGLAGRRYFEEHFDMSQQVVSLVKLLALPLSPLSAVRDR